MGFRTQPRTTSVTVRLPFWLVAELNRRASLSHTDRSEIVRVALIQAYGDALARDDGREAPMADA